MDRELKICHLYPEVLNLYGDRGNIICMKSRLERRGISCRVDQMRLGQKADLASYDLFFIGGGQDFEQEVLLEDLRSGKGAEILANRHKVYEEAKAMYPERWNGRKTRNWDLPEEVCLNPDKVVQGDSISQESEALAS